MLRNAAEHGTNEYKYRSSFVEMENCFLVAFSRFSSEKRFCLHSVATMNNGEEMEWIVGDFDVTFGEICDNFKNSDELTRDSF